MNHNLDNLTPSGIRRFTSLAKATPGCKMLTIGEPDFDTPLPIREAAIQALADGLTHYAPNRGTDSLRKAIADYEKKGNMVKFYVGSDDLTNWYEDDWDKRPYESNAGNVHKNFALGYFAN